jgi:hypothetical protein
MYQYKGPEAAAKQIAEAKAIAAARQMSLEEKKLQLGELRAAARMADEFAAEEARVAEEIERIITGVKRLPPPRYGGRAGLLAAAREAKEFTQRRKEMSTQ